MELSESFYIFISTMIIGLLYGILKLIQNSKCKSCSFCFNCCEIIRDTNAEIDEHKYNIEHNIND
jgi:hypothetical protein